MAARLQKVVKSELGILDPGRFRPGPPRFHSGTKVADGASTLAQRGYVSESSKSRFRMPNPV